MGSRSILVQKSGSQGSKGITKVDASESIKTSISISRIAILIIDGFLPRLPIAPWFFSVLNFAIFQISTL